jgi:hypothetical protein
MVTLKVNGIVLELTAKNEYAVKHFLSNQPRESKVTILETGEVLQINDIFDYERN